MEEKENYPYIFWYGSGTNTRPELYDTEMWLFNTRLGHLLKLERVIISPPKFENKSLSDPIFWRCNFVCQESMMLNIPN